MHTYMYMYYNVISRALSDSRGYMPPYCGSSRPLDLKLCMHMHMSMCICIYVCYVRFYGMYIHAPILWLRTPSGPENCVCICICICIYVCDARFCGMYIHASMLWRQICPHRPLDLKLCMRIYIYIYVCIRICVRICM